MKPSFLVRCVALALVGFSTACTLKEQERPDMTGPSEFGTSITITVTPDVLKQDGASQSIVRIVARDQNGNPKSNVQLRAEMFINGAPASFGKLSMTNLITGTDGRATTTFTAPLGADFVLEDFTIVTIAVTPTESDYANSMRRTVSLRLDAIGTVIPPDGLVAAFNVSPSDPTTQQTVVFDASSSQAPANNPIVSYAWDFGDGETDTTTTASTTHEYDEARPYVVRLTIADQFGRTATTTRTVTVEEGDGPEANFTFSPTTPEPNARVNFNASSSTASSGRRIVSYRWDFGDGTSAGSGVQVSHTYTRVGTYTVTLLVTDDTGMTDTFSTTVPVEEEETLTAHSLSAGKTGKR
jgi:PKD repeat protein